MFDVSSPPEEEADSRPLLPDAPLTPRTRRRFDSVRQLLERARAKLRNIPRARSGSRARGSQTSGGSREASEPGSPVHLPRCSNNSDLALPPSLPELLYSFPSLL